jgi:hypothetical protein
VAVRANIAKIVIGMSFSQGAPLSTVVTMGNGNWPSPILVLVNL